MHRIGLQNAFIVACISGFYGGIGLYCLPCPIGATCAGFTSTITQLSERFVDPVPIAGFFNLVCRALCVTNRTGCSCYTISAVSLFSSPEWHDGCGVSCSDRASRANIMYRPLLARGSVPRQQRVRARLRLECALLPVLIMRCVFVMDITVFDAEFFHVIGMTTLVCPCDRMQRRATTAWAQSVPCAPVHPWLSL
jgi:hypothetical protein